MDITAGDDVLGLFEQNVHRNMCPVLDSYRVNRGVRIIEINGTK
jgi:hypothetical protein